MNPDPITEQDYDHALALLRDGLTSLIHAQTILRRYTINGMLNESDAQVDRYADDISKLRTRIQKTADLRRKLKQRAKHRREIDAARRKNK